MEGSGACVLSLGDQQETRDPCHQKRQQVPDRGDAETVHGQVILANSRLASEYRRNGNINWGSFFEEMVDTLEANLPPAQVDDDQRERVERNLKLIRENGTSDLDAETMRKVFGECIEDVVHFVATRG